MGVSHLFQSIVNYPQFFTRLRYLQGLQVAAGFFQLLIIVASLQLLKNSDIYEVSKSLPASSIP